MSPTESTRALVDGFGQRFHEARRLAESVSLAVHVWPELLRRARVELNRGMPVGAEADLWFSPLVESASPRGLVLKPEVAQVLREQLDARRLEEAWELLEQFHPFAPPVVVLEETVTWLALKQKWMTEVEKERARKRIQLQLGQALHTLRTDGERELGLARWARYALPRLPKQAQEESVWWELLFEARKRLGGSWTLSRDELPDRVPPEPSRMLLEGKGSTRLRLYRERGSLVFLEPTGDVPGHDLEVPATTPVVLELTWHEDGKEHGRLTFPEPGVREPVPESVERIHLRALDGRRWDFVSESEKAPEPPAEEKPTGPPAVFLSYARSSRTEAEALRAALGEERVFQEVGLEAGTHVPTALVEALLASRVFVLFVDESYFHRWDCLWELAAALAPYKELGLEASQAARDEALSHVVVARSSSGLPSLMGLPPLLRDTQWPTADDTRGLERLVRARLDMNPPILGERLEALGRLGALRARLLEKYRLPPPMSLRNVRHFPRELPVSLGEAFVGREDELWRLHYLLSVQRPSDRAPAVCLEGLGGLGKTRLALEYAHRFGPRDFPGGIFWVDAEVAADSLEEQLHGILRTLRADLPDLVSFRQQKRDVRRELAEALEAADSREPILYVVDNVPEPGPDEPMRPLTTWCPAPGKVALLVTSRAMLSPGSEALTSQPLGSLAPESAVALLRHGVTRELPLELWHWIAEWVGFLPLALELLNRALRVGTLEPEELLRMSREQGPVGMLDSQSTLLRRYVPPEAVRGVSETFRLSYERLSEQERSVAVTLAWLAPEPLPLHLIKMMGSEFEDAGVRVTLRARGFVTPVTEEGSVPMFGRMHPLMADFLRGQTAEPTPHLVPACLALMDLMTPSAIQQPREWPLLDACLPHGEQVFHELQRLRVPTLVESGLHLANRLVLFLTSRGLFPRALRLAESAVEQATSRLGPEHPLTRTALLQLAVVRQATGDYAGARELMERVVELNRRLLGEEHPETLLALNNLAVLLGQLGDYEGARMHLEWVLKARQRVSGEDSSATLSAMSNLAVMLLARGDLGAAHELLRKALQSYSQEFGGEHPDTLRVMENLARVLQSQGELAEARALEEQVLETRRRVLGELHPETLTAMNHLAPLLSTMGALEEARALEERALQLSRRLLGEEHPDTLTAMGNLAATLHAQGELERARELEERVLEVRRRHLGEEHPDTLTAMGNLATTLRAQRQLAYARELEERVLEVRRRQLGKEHPATLAAMGHLAETVRAQGELEYARWLEEGVLEARRHHLGEEHPDTLTAMGNLATTLRAQRQLAYARELEDRVLEVCERILGKDHPATLTAMNNLAMTLLEQGHAAKAERLLRTVRERGRDSLGEEHPLTRHARQLLDQLSGRKPLP